MRSSTTCSVEHQPGTPFPKTETDWEAVDAMTEEEVHAAALADPDAQPISLGSDDEMAAAGLIRIVNVKRLREKLQFTQEEFAQVYHIPIGTLRDWEQRRKTPDATARAYLTVIARNPQAVAEWLKPAA
jgi:putative transcriptional regulator